MSGECREQLLYLLTYRMYCPSVCPRGRAEQEPDVLQKVLQIKKKLCLCGTGKGKTAGPNPKSNKGRGGGVWKVIKIINSDGLRGRTTGQLPGGNSAEQQLGVSPEPMGTSSCVDHLILCAKTQNY